MTKTVSEWYSSLENILMQEEDRTILFSIPNHEGLIDWPINKDSKTLLGFGDTTRIVSERSLALYEVLDQMQGF